MLFPRLPRAFTRKSHKAENKRERTIQGKFLIPVPEGTVLSAEFPRRVTHGEVLLEYAGKKILAPVNGVASLSFDQKHFLVKQDGTWSTSTPFESKTYVWDSLLSAFDEGAIYSLDLIQVSLKDYFLSFQKDKDITIVLSPYCRYQHLNFKELIEQSMPDAYSLFVDLLQSLFPKASIKNYFISKEIQFEHPLGIPEFFVHKMMNLSVETSRKKINDFQILYLGAETIYHILRKLYFNESFTKRHLSVFLVDKKGRMDTVSRQFYLTNGQALAFIPKNLDTRYKVASFQSFFDSIDTLEVNSLGYFNIYEHFSLTFYERLPVHRNEFVCIECGECNIYCPTNSNPFALVKERNSEFDSGKCVSCGICTVYCPSGIDIRKRILDIKSLNLEPMKAKE